MNKRIKKKTGKSKNFQRQNIILKELSKHFKIKTKTFGNGYFVFDLGENAVCHFTLKETPQWEYGIWLGEGNKFEIFGDHEDSIDKFKPSRTYLSYNQDTLQEFIADVNNIYKNPKLYFVDSYYGKALEITDSIEQENFVNKHYEEYINDKIQRLNDEDFDRKLTFDFFKKIPNLEEDIIAVGVRDKNRKGWRCSPRYDLYVVATNKISQEKIDDLYEKIDNLVHEKNYSDNRKTYEHQFSLHGIFDSLDDIKKCDYKYYKQKRL